MKVQVTHDGVLIPKKLLKNIDEVEIRQENGCILMLPIPNTDDPLSNFGKYPVDCGITDASERYDRYIYDQK